jgi:glycosyltransferase involved in cell wall biosynthesis
MRITHISTYDVSGGAARAAYRLHTGLRELGQDSKMLVQQKDSSDQSVIPFQPRTDAPGRLRRMLRRRFLEADQKLISVRPEGASYFSDDRSEHRADLLRQVPPSDILHLHWIAGFFDYSDFFRLIPHKLPIVWTLHDMNPFTGGCHFDARCGKYHAYCGACPQIGSSKEDDFSAQAWARKKKAFGAADKSAFHLVAPSRWLAEEAKKSTLLGHLPVIVIPYGVDTERFQPRDKRPARERYGIPMEAKVILFVADWASEKRKGLDMLHEAIQGMKDDKELYFLTIGRGVSTKGFGPRAIGLDYVRDDIALSSIYSAANVFVVPSRQDNLPNTALEALACGIPTIAFATGGLPDIVRDGETGVLVPPGNVGALRVAIMKVSQDPELQSAMSESCRRTALAEYRLEMQARRYATLYETLLAVGTASAKVTRA